jgi:hypothetical protein
MRSAFQSPIFAVTQKAYAKLLNVINFLIGNSTTALKVSERNSFKT